MILISHRGNTNGPNPKDENKPEYIDKTILAGFDVEIDLWLNNYNFFLGHDLPQYKISIEWLKDRSEKLWIHCKNLESISFLTNKKFNLNFFWHDVDKYTLTSKGFIWTYPSQHSEFNTICVLPEKFGVKNFKCDGICSDFILNYSQ